MQPKFVYVRVFHPNAPSYCNSNIPSIYWRNEQEKERQYGDCVREVKNPSFIPLVFATSGDMGREATVFYHCLAGLLSCKSMNEKQEIMLHMNFPKIAEHMILLLDQHLPLSVSLDEIIIYIVLLWPV